MTRRQTRPIADAITPDHNHPGIRLLPQNPRQSPHKNMEPAIRLQITGDIGNQFLLGRNMHILNAELATMRRGVRAAQFQIHPFAQDSNFFPHPVRVSTFLKFRRRLTVPRRGQGLQVDGVFRPDQRHHGGLHGEFRVKPDVKPRFIMIIKFKIAQHRHAGEHILNIQQFPPAMMANDDIRLKPKVLSVLAAFATASARTSPRSNSRAPGCVCSVACRGIR